MSNLVKQGVELFFGNQRFLITHLEFSNVCNRHCSYCMEGNYDLSRKNDDFSDETKLIKLVDKIYRRIKPEDFMLFILVGGEPTCQPALPAMVNKIRSRPNTTIMITTNLTQSVEFYRKLDVPLIVSLHLENNDIDLVLKKIEQLSDLIVHVRIMACPEKFEEFKIAYMKVIQLSKHLNLNFACEHVFAYLTYVPHYSLEYQIFLDNTIRNIVEYPESLNQKLGLARGLFHVPQWWELVDGQLKSVAGNTRDFTGMHCEKNLISIEKTGRLFMSWCIPPTILNAFEVDELPEDLFSNIICQTHRCGLGYLAALPKYKSIKYAPEYIKKVK